MGKRCGTTTRSGERRSNREGTVKGDSQAVLLFFSSFFSFCRVISEGNLGIGLLSLRPGFLFRFYGFYIQRVVLGESSRREELVFRISVLQ